MKSFLFVFFLFYSFVGYSQADSIKLIKYSPKFRFKEGVYLNHTQMVNNKPIAKSRIISKYNKKSFEFYDKILGEETINYYDDYGLRKEVDVFNLWGFCRRGSIFVNWGDEFSRVTVIGSICHFVSAITFTEERVYNDSYSYSSYNTPTTTSRTEVRQFLMVFATGKIIDYSYENVLLLLMTDTELYDEYNKLKKKKKKEMKFLYVRKFNEKQKLYIPIN